MSDRMRSGISAFWSWVTQDKHKQAVQHIKEEAERAFTEHPHETGETYFQHLWFTIRMAGRFAFVSLVVLIHGIFPFLFVRTASRQIEIVYGIMKRRIPKSRRAELDAQHDSHYGEHI